MSMYENWEMPETDRMLIRLTDKTVWKYSFSSHSWVQDTSMPYLKRAGAGRLLANPVTNKLFFADTAQITRLIVGMPAS